MGDYDDERPDWREIDRKKDRSGFYGRKQEKGQLRDTPADRFKAGRVKEALDRLFKGEKGTPEHDKLFAKLHSTYGGERFLPTVQKYVEKYGLPDDSPTLLLLLDAKDEGIGAAAMGKLKELYPSLAPRQKEDVKRKLSIVAATDRSREIRRLAGLAAADLD